MKKQQDIASDSQTDAALIARVKAGGHDSGAAYSVLVARYQGKVVRLAGYLLAGAADSDDVAQEAFLRAFLALKRFPNDGNFMGWMRVITTRLAYNHRRDENTRRKYQQSAAPLTREALRGLADDVPNRQAIERVLEQMSYPYREALVLRYLEGMSVKELAGVLDLGTSAVKMRLMRAREQFVRVWREETGGEDGAGRVLRGP